MAISNYGELKSAVANWLARDSLTNRIPELIAFGEFRLYSDLRVRFMESSVSVTVTISTQTSALPTAYLQGRSVYISGSPNLRLEYRSPVEFWSVYSSLTSAKPTVYTIEGENFEWGPLPDAGYTAKVNYYKRPTALSADADTDGLFSLAPQLLLYASLIESAPFLGNDPRILTWSAMYDDLLAKIHAADARDRYSGDTRTAERQAQVT